MVAKDKGVINKDVENLARTILLDYIEDEVIIEELISKIYNIPDFLNSLECYIVNQQERNELVGRLRNIYNILNYILNKLDNKSTSQKLLYKLLNKNKYDTEIECNDIKQQNQYDFINNQYEVTTKIKYILIEKKMTQADLAKKTGIAPATISNIIRQPSKANLLNILKIVSVLNVDINKIFYLADKDKK